MNISQLLVTAAAVAGSAFALWAFRVQPPTAAPRAAWPLNGSQRSYFEMSRRLNNGSGAVLVQCVVQLHGKDGAEAEAVRALLRVRGRELLADALAAVAEQQPMLRARLVYPEGAPERALLVQPGAEWPAPQLLSWCPPAPPAAAADAAAWDWMLREVDCALTPLSTALVGVLQQGCNMPWRSVTFTRHKQQQPQPQRHIMLQLAEANLTLLHNTPAASAAPSTISYALTLRLNHMLCDGVSAAALLPAVAVALRTAIYDHLQPPAPQPPRIQPQQVPVQPPGEVQALWRMGAIDERLRAMFPPASLALMTLRAVLAESSIPLHQLAVAPSVARAGEVAAWVQAGCSGPPPPSTRPAALLHTTTQLTEMVLPAPTLHKLRGACKREGVTLGALINGLLAVCVGDAVAAGLLPPGPPGAAIVVKSAASLRPLLSPPMDDSTLGYFVGSYGSVHSDLVGPPQDTPHTQATPPADDVSGADLWRVWAAAARDRSACVATLGTPQQPQHTAFGLALIKGYFWRVLVDRFTADTGTHGVKPPGTVFTSNLGDRSQSFAAVTAAAEASSPAAAAAAAALPMSLRHLALCSSVNHWRCFEVSAATLGGGARLLWTWPHSENGEAGEAGAGWAAVQHAPQAYPYLQKRFAAYVAALAQ